MYTYRSLQSILFQKTCISLLQSFVLRFSRSNLENKKIMVDQIIASFSMNFERKRNCTLNVPLTQTTSIILPNFRASRSAVSRSPSIRRARPVSFLFTPRKRDPSRLREAFGFSMRAERTIRHCKPKFPKLFSRRTMSSSDHRADVW